MLNFLSYESDLLLDNAYSIAPSLFCLNFDANSLILLQIAYKVGDPNIPRAWSRHSSNKESKTTKNDKEVADSKSLSSVGSERAIKSLRKNSDVDDPKLQEFLEVVQPRVKSKLWGNDTLITPAADQNGKVRERQSPVKKKSTEKSTPVDTESDEEDEMETGPSDGQATDNSQIPAHDDVVSDMDYFKSRVKNDWSDSDSSESGDDDDDDDDDNKDDNSSLSESHEEQDAQEEVPNRELIASEKDVSRKVEKKQGLSQEDSAAEMLDGDGKEEAIETSRLFVRNLPYAATYSSFS